MGLKLVKVIQLGVDDQVDEVASYTMYTKVLQYSR